MVIAINVIKRDGSAEAFAPHKIARSCVRAGVPQAIADRIAEEISRKVYINIPTSQIRRMVAKALSRYYPAAARAYLSYEIRTPELSKPKAAYRHRHRARARLQKVFGGRARHLPTGHKIARSRLAKKKIGAGRPPT